VRSGAVTVTAAVAEWPPAVAVIVAVPLPRAVAVAFTPVPAMSTIPGGVALHETCAFGTAPNLPTTLATNGWPAPSDVIVALAGLMTTSVTSGMVASAPLLHDSASQHTPAAPVKVATYLRARPR